MAEEPESAAERQRTRRMIAFWIIIASVVGIAGVAALAIIFAKDGTQRADTTRLIFTSMLPLFGTWVGTVLAFYFTRDSLEAATESTLSTLRASGTFDDGTPVTSVMIPVSKIAAMRVAAGGVADDILLHDVFQKMEDSGFLRIPILGDSGQVLYIVHRVIIDQFAGSLSKDPSDAAAFSETLGALLAVAELKALVEAYAFVAQDDVLSDARAAMRAVEGANDVFVTASGQRSEAIIGWLTNTDMAGSN